nr:CpsD/CapB family tyrosine-protein kinase [Nakamurella flavida]
MTRAQVQRSIAASADLNTVLLSATVTDTSDTRSLQIAGAVAAQLGALVDDLDNSGSADAPNVQLNVISGPTLNPTPVSPRPTLNIGLGLLVGLAAGLALAILRQVLDTTVRSPQVLRALTKAPVLGVISFDRGARKSPLISDSSARSLRAESFRQLRTNLQFVDVQQPVRVLVVTSSLAGEGKSSTAVNLAMTFSDSGQRVLLIEADLRRPRVADYMGLERSVGLTNVLLGQVSIDDVLQPWGRGGLTVLPSGTIPPNPSELLGSPSMAELLDSLAATFDMIVIDTPPLLPVTDAAVAATRSDGAVLVVRHGKTSRNDIATALRSLDAVGARFLGTILTMAPTRGADRYGSSGYGYYEDKPRRRDRAAGAAVAELPPGDEPQAPQAPSTATGRRDVPAPVPES